MHNSLGPQGLEPAPRCCQWGFPGKITGCCSMFSPVRLSVTPWTAACQAPLSFTISLILLKHMSVESRMLSNRHVLCCPHLLLPSVFPSISVFFNQSVIYIRWPKSWSFSFSIRHSNGYSGLISFRIDCFDLAVQGALKRLSNITVQKHQFFHTHPSLWSNNHIST